MSQEQEVQEMENVPQGIQQQAKKADELIQQAANPNTQEGSEAAEQESELSEAQYSEQEAGQQDKDSKPKETWKDRYQVLKGKYDAEVPRLNQENKDLKQQIQDLSTQIQNLQQKMEQSSEQSSEQSREEASGLNPDDFAEYGEEFQQLVERLNSLESENQNLKSQLSSVNETVGSVQEHQQQSVTERFWQELDSAVPNWEQINQDQDFLNWLGEFDPVGGQTRNDALQEAHANLDMRRVAAIFNSFIENETGSKYRQNSKQESKQKKQERPQNVQPPRSTAETPPTQQQGQNVWTPEGITHFYDKVRRGVYKGREEEMNKLERDIFQAQHEGRIQV